MCIITESVLLLNGSDHQRARKKLWWWSLNRTVGDHGQMIEMSRAYRRREVYEWYCTLACTNCAGCVLWPPENVTELAKALL